MLFVANGNIKEYKFRYDNHANCQTIGKECALPLKIDQKIEAPIFVYYQLDNFLQNHRRYIKSRSNKQLAGDEVELESARTDCEPALTNQQTVPESIIKEKGLKPEDVAWPCGLIAKSFFNGEIDNMKNW